MLGFASTVMASWEILLPWAPTVPFINYLAKILLTAYARLFTFVLIDGGTALLFWGFIVVALGMLMVYASVAEMASM